MKQKSRPVAFGLVTLLLTSVVEAAPPVEPERLPAFGRSVAGTDDSTAVVQNPANLAYLPGPELRWEGVYLPEDSKVPGQGHAFTLGFGLPFSFATALRVDFVDPPRAAFSAHADNYQWVTWGLALKASDAFAVGASLEHSYSSGIVASGLGSYSLAASFRPNPYLGISVVGHELSGPLDGDTAARLSAFGVPNVALGPSSTFAVAVRPLGTRALEVGLEARYLVSPEVWEPRGTLGIDVPWIGRLRGEFLVRDVQAHSPEWRASASLAVHFNGTAVSIDGEGGAVTGTALGGDGMWGGFHSLSLQGFREAVGSDPPKTAMRIRLESTPGTREHVALLRRLWRLSEERSVSAVLLELRTSPADSLAHIEELRDALFVLRARGKRVLCHIEDGGGAALYLCSAADRTLVNPAGGLRFAGLRTRHIYLAKLLDNLGIKADFIRIGAHKSAPERFTRENASEVSRADSIDLLQQMERWFSGDIAHDKHMPVEEFRRRIAKGPFVASEAEAAGLIDGVAFDDELKQKLRDLTGTPVDLVDTDFAEVAPERFGTQKSLALVYLDGDIIDGRSRSIPFLDMQLVGSYTIAETLRRLRENPQIGAIVLRIESPGGSSMASDVMWREVALTAKQKPVIVSMGDVAASGGYYVAAPATKIFANPLTITGSIGVFYGKADVSGLFSKIGVNVEVYKTAPRADAESLFRPFSDDERRELEHKVGQFYDTFLSRVSEGRHMDKAAVDRVGQGRVWTGEQAKAIGLVDELGGLRQALAEARRLADLPNDVPILELPKIRTSLIGQLLGIEGLKADAFVALPDQLKSVARTMAPFFVHAQDQALMRLEIAPIVP